jgi:hypothetical protein
MQVVADVMPANVGGVRSGLAARATALSAPTSANSAIALRLHRAKRRWRVKPAVGVRMRIIALLTRVLSADWRSVSRGSRGPASGASGTDRR